MTDYREQAIRDVADVLDTATEAYDLRDYAVAQRERVLELEAREAELLRAVSAGNETVLDLKERVLEIEASIRDAILHLDPVGWPIVKRTLEAQLQQKEGETNEKNR